MEVLFSRYDKTDCLSKHFSNWMPHSGYFYNTINDVEPKYEFIVLNADDESEYLKEDINFLKHPIKSIKYRLIENHYYDIIIIDINTNRMIFKEIKRFTYKELYDYLLNLASKYYSYDNILSKPINTNN